jgi:serine protease SohB
MDFLTEYGLFLAETVTVVVAIVVVAGTIAATATRGRRPDEGHLEVRCLNDQLGFQRETLESAVLDKKAVRRTRRARTRERKKVRGTLPRVYVLNFEGDLQASATERLRHEVTSVLSVARKEDEVVVRLESAGGVVHGYGLAASQLHRIKEHGVALTVAVDKVAASGGYLVACLADKLISSPFAVLGSIGVMAEIPNVHRLLKRHDIDVELLTAGEFKRTLTVLGENTDKGRQKFIEELEDVHKLFKEHVARHRPVVDIEAVSTGETWYGPRALDRKLSDELMTSDEYLAKRCDDADVYEVRWVVRRSPFERLVQRMEGMLGRRRVSDFDDTRAERI